MLEGLCIEDEELRKRILDSYDIYDILELLGIEAAQVLDMYWSKVQDNPEIFSDVLTEMDYDEGNDNE